MSKTDSDRQVRLDEADPRWRPDYNPKTGTAWNRYRGRIARGRARRGTDALADLAMAIAELGEVHQMLSKAYEIDVGEQNSRPRDAAVAEAMGRLRLASRFLDEVAIRCGSVPGDCLPRRRARGTMPPVLTIEDS